MESNEGQEHHAKRFGKKTELVALSKLDILFSYKKNKKFKYKLVEEGGSSNHLAASIDWLTNNDTSMNHNTDIYWITIWPLQIMV